MKNCNFCNDPIDGGLYGVYKNKMYDLCDDCISNIESLFEGYGHTSEQPILFVEGDTDDDVLIGIEVEFDRLDFDDTEKGIISYEFNEELGAKNARWYSNRLVHTKYDGSLSSGFELVYQPMTINYLVSNFDTILNQIKFCINSVDDYSGYAGFHLHISKNAFECEEDIRSLNNFLAKRRRFFYNFFGRDTERDDSYYHLYKWENGCINNTRYSGINVTANTVECRLGASPRTVNDFISTLIGMLTLLTRQKFNDISDFEKQYNEVYGLIVNKEFIKGAI